MAENVMSFANETVSSRSASAFEKAGSMQPAKSQKVILAAGAQPALAANTDSARSPLVNKLKPKQPYLKRGTGLQSRLTAAKHRRYVPKGGFIKGQAEDEGCQLHNAATAVDYSTNTSTISSHPSQPQHPDLPRELVESECAGSSLEVAEQCMANETSHAIQQHIYAQFAHPHQANSFGAAQFHATADIEAELDADTALVHFPHGRHDDQDMPAQNSHKQHLESRRHREDPQDVPDRQGNQNFMHAAAGNFHRDSLAGQLAATGVSDWQMQQAAEALELEEFRALERQITQDNGSVRGSVASLSSVPAWQRHNSSTAMRKSMGLHHMVQQHQQPLLDAIQKPDRQQSVRSQLSETNELVLEHFQGVRQAAAQRPLPRVTGNPFADPEDCDPDGNSHLSAPVAAQHEPEDTMLCSQLPTSHPCYRHEASVEPQPFAYTDVGTESAWDAVSASANTNESSQAVLQPDNPSQKYIQQMFRRQQPQVAVEKNPPQPPDTETVAIAALEQEMKALKDDRARVSKLQTQLEQSSKRMEQEKAAWKQQQSDEAAAWEAEKEAESQRLKRHQRVLDKQSRALLKLPNRKERSEVEAVEAVLEQERKASNAKDARHKLTVERLRQKLVELQDTNAELRAEIRFHEQRRLDEWNAKENKQPKTSSRGKAGTAHSEAAASTSRSNKVEQSTQEASSQPVMRASHSIQQRAPARGSQAHALSPSDAQHMPAAGIYQASIADDVSDNGDNHEAIYTEAAGPAADHWQTQSQSGLEQASMAQHEQGVSALPFSQQAEHKWQSNLQANHINPDVSRPLPSQHASQGMNAFQPIMDMGLQSTSSQKALSASTRLQPARQPAAMAADRYQHATDLASPEDDFVWQPIRPQTSQRSEQYTAMHDTAAGSHAVSAADTPDSQDPMWMTHVGPLSGTGRNSRSLRESLDAAARLDSRLQLAQQEQQQQQQSHWPMQEPQWHLRQGQQNEPAATFAQASSSSWQTMQDPYAVVQPAASEHAANMRHRQQPLSDASAPPLHDVIPLTDRFGPQQGADFLPGRQGQYHMAPIGSSSADWSTHAEPDAVQQARLHGSRLSGMQGVAQHNSWVAEASQEESSTEQAAHESQHATSSGNAAAGNGCRAEATAQVPAAGSDPQHPYQELNYPDGKVEQVFLDGHRSVLFANGTRKQQFPDGHTTIRFTNQDIKRFFPCGRVEYYYCEVDTWHTTHANGIEVFYFPNGQTEAHHPSGTKEIIFPDSVIRRVFADGREQDVTPEQLSSPVKHPIPEDKD